MWFPNENGIVFHIFSVFFLQGGGERELLDFEKTRHIFTPVFGFCLELTFNGTNLLPFDVLGPRSQLYIQVLFSTHNLVGEGPRYYY